MVVVHFAHLWITEDFVCELQFLEVIGVAAFVRMAVQDLAKI
jgi:hypothetical protein